MSSRTIVDTIDISNNAVTEPKLASNSVTTAKINNGAVTSPKLASTSNEANWVTGRVAAQTHTEVGMYIFASPNVTGIFAWGSTIAGSQLNPASVYRPTISSPWEVFASSTTLSGTWKCMGHCVATNGTTARGVTMWMRIA